MNTAAANAPAPEPNPTPTQTQEDPAVLAAKARAHVEEQFASIADSERHRLAVARGLVNPKDGTLTKSGLKLAEAHGSEIKDGKFADIGGLRNLVPLPGDTIRYAKDSKGNSRIATDRHGFISFPKQRGRRKPHISAHLQTIKNRSISVFRGLFLDHAADLQAKAKAAGEVFNGVPVDDFSKLGARAAVIGAARVKAEQHLARRRARNQQKLSRKINAGILPGNTNRRAYCG
jgi:hypothetical protein